MAFMTENRRNEVRVSDQDPEMLAIKAIGSALAPLDQEAAIRILKWADARYGQQRALDVGNKLHEAVMRDLKAVSEALDLFTQAAREVNLSPPIALNAVLQRIYDEAVAEMEAKKATADAA